jgi:hypothetical protein
MNTPELTLKELQEMEHDLKQYYGGCFPFGERKLESLLSLARIQIESQGVTRKSEGPSSTLPASSDTGGADAPPADPRLSPPNVWWSYHKKSGTWYDEPAAHNEIPSTSEYEDIECRCIPIGPLQTDDQSHPIHTEESPSDSELLTDGDVERLEDLQKALKAEGYRNSLSHEMGVLIPRILPVLRSVIKAAMKQEKQAS